MIIAFSLILIGILLFWLGLHLMDDYEPVLSLLSAFLASLSIAVGVCFPIDKTTTKYYIADEMKNNEAIALLESNYDEYTMKYIEDNELKTIDEGKSDTKIYFDAEKPFIEVERTQTLFFSGTSMSLHFQTQEQMEQLIGNE